MTNEENIWITTSLFGYMKYVRCASGPTCVKCSHERSPYQCNGRDHCDSGEMCFVSLDARGYTAGCRSANHCYDGTFNDHDHGQYTQYCCFEYMCNEQLIQNFNSHPTTTKRPLPTHPTQPPTHPTQPPTTQAPTTEAPAFILTEGVNCHVCSGGLCGTTDKEYSIKCPNGFPYCMNFVENDASGNKLVSKRCASIDECKQTSHFLENTPNHSQCNAFDPAEIYPSTFECAYCCETSYCNKDIIPPVETRVLGTRK